MSFGKIFKSVPTPSREEENNLIARYHAGEPGALDELFRVYSRSMYHACLNKTKNEDTAEELFSLLYEDIIEGFNKFDPSRNTRLSTFLGSVINRRANRHLAPPKEISTPTDEMKIFDGSQDALEDSLRAEFVSHLYDFLTTVPDDTRWVVHCRQEGMSFKQIAHELTIRRGRKVTIEDAMETMKIVQNDLLIHLRQVGMCDRKYVGDAFDWPVNDLLR